MKKTLAFTACLTIILVCDAFGQYRDRTGTLNIGLKAGGTASFIQNPRWPISGIKIGSTAGLFLNYFHTESVNLQLEVGLVSKGGIYERSFRDSATQARALRRISQNLQYLNVPITTNFYFKDNGVASLYMQFGFYSNFLLSAKMEDLSGSDEPGSMSSDNEEAFNDREAFGIVGGIGMDINGFNVEGRINLGVLNINADPRIPKTTNQAAQVTIGYFF